MPKVSRVKFDIHLEGIPQESPKYRVYVDSDLLVERTFLWDNNKNFIQENLVLVVEPGAHTLKIERVPGNADFKVDNCFVDDVPFTMGGSFQETFIVK